MFIAINKFKVKKESSADFEKVWKERQSHLSEVPGFMRFWLLKTEAPENFEFLSHSQWVNQEAFEGWRKGEAMGKAHANASSVGSMLQGPPEFKGYEMALDEVAGHRTDYRSVFIDRKVEKNFVRETDFQKALLEKNKAHNLPPINIGPFEGQMLMMLVRSVGARTGVEVGTLGGYSASWLLRGMKADGKLYTLELEKDRAEWVKEYYRGSPDEKRLEVIAGAAKDTLHTNLKDLKDLDFVFIDADKRSYCDYLEWAMPRVKSGGLILLDNSYIWGGMNYWQETWNHPPASNWASFQKGAFEGMSKSWEMLCSNPEFDALVLPTGEGLLAALKK
jgi:predicted O-methyltransferase YrrM/heme-degrading monooxygenase HmoA